MKRVVKLTVNGEEREVFIEPWRTLSEVLRDDLELTGLKIGCDNGDCGSCSILLDGQVVKSCIMLAVQAEGRKIQTIEGLSEGDRLDPLQEAFHEHFAVQCGYCTPGMILTAKSLLDKNRHATEEEIREYMSGNLCRCGCYPKITEAILEVGKAD